MVLQEKADIPLVEQRDIVGLNPIFAEFASRHFPANILIAQSAQSAHIFSTLCISLLVAPPHFGLCCHAHFFSQSQFDVTSRWRPMERGYYAPL